ncbi:MAG: succinylglutamate desuccinylase [Panacagrimonas sp.]
MFLIRNSLLTGLLLALGAANADDGKNSDASSVLPSEPVILPEPESAAQPAPRPSASSGQQAQSEGAAAPVPAVADEDPANPPDASITPAAPAKAEVEPEPTRADALTDAEGDQPEPGPSTAAEQAEPANNKRSPKALSLENNVSEWLPFEILGTSVPVGTIRHMGWRANAGFGVLNEPTPVLVVHGNEPGPVLCLTAAVHGDELNGIDIVRRVIYGLDPKALKGTVVGVPIVNLQGFQRGSRYLPDRRDLNRSFPGDPNGSLASRIAHSFFEQIVRKCNGLVDVHTGSFHRSNLSQLRADMRHETIANMTHGFGEIAVLQTIPAVGTLRQAATDAGIPTVTVEAGEPLRLQPGQVTRGVQGIESLLTHLGMTRGRLIWRIPQPIYYESTWVRAERGGILFSRAGLGDFVRQGEVLGTVTNPVTNARTDIVAPVSGRVLGRALNQFVMPGFAAYRLGIERSEEALASEVPEADVESADETPETGGGELPERIAD